MTLLGLAGLAGAVFLLAITPGPGVFATVSKALSSGFKHTVPVVLGIVAGDLIFLLFAIYGLAVIAESFSALFMLIRYLGSGYLVWLGIKLWRSKPGSIDVATIKPQSSKYSFLGGLSITLGNPKVIIFYLSFLPTFIKLDALSTLDVVAVASVVSLVLGNGLFNPIFSIPPLYVPLSCKTNWRNKWTPQAYEITKGKMNIGKDRSTTGKPVV